MPTIQTFTVKQDKNSPFDLQIEGTAFGVKAAVCPRDRIRPIAKHGLYLLLDDRRLCCYVGSSSQNKDGVATRVKAHVIPKEGWWTHAVIFYDAFDNCPADLVLWCESRLFELAKRRMVVLSTATERSDPGDGALVLEKILLLCAILGIPISSETSATQIQGELNLSGRFCRSAEGSSHTPQKEPSPTPSNNPRIDNPALLPKFPDGEPIPCNWKNSRTNVAATIAKWFNMGAGGINQLLDGSHRYSAGKDRKQALLAFGIPFVGKYVENEDSWKKAHLPCQHKKNSLSDTDEREPRKNHHVPNPNWPSFQELAWAILVAEKGEEYAQEHPGTARGYAQKLGNEWHPSRNSWAHANQETRRLLERYGVEFDDKGYVKSCARVTNPLTQKEYPRPVS